MEVHETTSEKKENTQISPLSKLLEREDLMLSVIEVPAETISLNGLLKKSMVNFYFCVEGTARFEFGPHYSRELQHRFNYFFYNPERDLPFRLVLQGRTKIVILEIPLESLHMLFVHESLPFLKQENINRKFYDEREIPAHLMVVLHQIFNTKLAEANGKIYYHGKALELLSLYFSTKNPDTESCPFLNDEETVRKLKHAKDFLLKHMDSPPGLKELAKTAGLNEYQLKVGFKEIYGDTVFGFLLSHRLDHSRVLLDTGKFQVNEVAYQIGYTNPSHYIAAFKKKFGVTPKKYLMNKG